MHIWTVKVSSVHRSRVLCAVGGGKVARMADADKEEPAMGRAGLKGAHEELG